MLFPVQALLAEAGRSLEEAAKGNGSDSHGNAVGLAWHWKEVGCFAGKALTCTPYPCVSRGRGRTSYTKLQTRRPLGPRNLDDLQAAGCLSPFTAVTLCIISRGGASAERSPVLWQAAQGKVGADAWIGDRRRGLGLARLQHFSLHPQVSGVSRSMGEMHRAKSSLLTETSRSWGGTGAGHPSSGHQGLQDPF